MNGVELERQTHWLWWTRDVISGIYTDHRNCYRQRYYRCPYSFSMYTIILHFFPADQYLYHRIVVNKFNDNENERWMLEIWLSMRCSAFSMALTSRSVDSFERSDIHYTTFRKLLIEISSHVCMRTQICTSRGPASPLRSSIRIENVLFFFVCIGLEQVTRPCRAAPRERMAELTDITWWDNHRS